MNATSQGWINPSGTLTPASASTIRPRNPKTFSSSSHRDSDHGAPNGAVTTQLGSGTSSPYPSRGASPIPSTHPSRPNSSSRTARPSGSLNEWTSFGTGSHSEPDASPARLGTRLWGSSWATLQSVASTVLGGDGGEGRKDRPASKWKTRPVKRSGSPARQGHFNTNGPTTWGPSPVSTKPEDYVGTGSREAREALVRAKRRENLLAANGLDLPDASGKFKRRLSDDRSVSASAPPPDQGRDYEQDALVYVHRVEPKDTLAGVIIQFNCQPAVFRKANRLWPNDSIQTRKTVVLPVDACGVKGKPIAEALDEDDLLGSGASELPSDRIQDDIWGTRRESSLVRSKTTDTGPPSSSASVSQEHHEDPPWKHESWVRIEGQPSPVEIGRMPRRILGYFPPSRRKSVSWSDVETPSASIDLPRYSDTLPRPTRTKSASLSQFAHQLQGPGGVGTLGSTTRSPGPGPDRFNKYLAPHLPNVAPRASFESLDSHASGNLENVGSAIEGWVRKFATRAAALVENPGSAPSGQTGDGDLIELMDGLDGSEVGGPPRGGDSSGRDDTERALRERFPVRGRTSGSERRKDD
ncbi:MAG: hypothetical protein M1833_004088 [Piccolia ochrophora]|nr:MAG: hypothetical protein M1833_004088 [Piccolia ochrophora]